MNTILKVFEWLLKTTIAVLVFLIASVLITNWTGARPWVAGVVLCVLGLGLYCSNVLLTRSFTINHTLELASDEIEIGARAVPKWINNMGLLGISALVASEILIFLYVFA